MILFGFKSCGKTHFGKLLSQHLQLPFIDTDERIEEKHGQSARELYKLLREEAFRSLETEIIQSLAPNAPTIIAVGGGSMMNPLNSSHLKRLGKLIYLKVDFQTVQARIESTGAPAFLSTKSLFEVYQERIPLYEAYADITVDASQQNTLQTLLEIYGE